MIAFSSSRDSHDGNHDIFIMMADGSRQRNLTKNLASVHIDLAWSPDGRKIVFEKFGKIYVMNNADGKHLINLTPNQPLNLGSYAPAWSPDGRKIAFERDRDIYVMNANGKRPVRLTFNVIGFNREPAWSPDGRRIAFYSNRGRKQGICLMDAANGRNFRRISDNGEYYPSWSPTGTHIAFSLIGESKVGVMKANGKDRRILFRGGQPSWRPDGPAAVDPVRKLHVAWGWVKRDL